MVAIRDAEKTKAYKAAYYLARKATSPNGKYPPLQDVSIVVVPNFKGDDGRWAKCRTFANVQHRSFSYEVWKRVRLRCTEGSVYQRAAPGYVGCTLHPDFAEFQSFVEWHGNQIGFGVDGYSIDKDMLVRGNKVYGPETCVLVPIALNSFWTKLPKLSDKTGVRPAPHGKFTASIKINDRFEHLGTFSSHADASKAYLAAKIAAISQWIKRLEDGEFSVDKRVIEALKNWRIDVEAI